MYGKRYHLTTSKRSGRIFGCFLKVIFPVGLSSGFAVHSHFIQELQDAIGARSADRKVTSLRKVTDLFLDQGNRLGQAQIEVFDRLLLSFIGDSDVDVLVELSRKLAPIAFAPAAVVRKLASDPNAAVASPVLTQSPVLSGS
ncbi:MAG: hypothetical protein ACRCV5_22740, partial [Afipia sp.]